MKRAMLLVGACLLLGAPAVQARWYTYEGCSLLTSEFADGDSFHVKTKSRHYIFRLYFVDAPETDKRYPDRIAEQAAYWGMAEEDVLKLGEKASAFTRQFLAKDFTGYSRLANARGHSDRDRYFAMVKAEKEFLCEALVRNGLARVYGRGLTLPDGTSMGKWWQHLRQLENRAKRAGLGGWGMAHVGTGGSGTTRRGGRLRTDAVPEQDVVLPRDVVIYSLEKGGRYLGRLRRDTRVTVLGAVSPTRVKIRYAHGGEQREAQCRKTDLGL